MTNDLVKRMIKKDGSLRISFYRDDYAGNPRDMTDEPLHCEDWARNYSIMNKQERENKSSSARKLLGRMIIRHTDWQKVIDFLVDNGKHMSDGNCKSDDALVYNKSEHRWDLMSDMFHYNAATKKNEMGWCLNNHYYEKKYYIDLYGLLEDVCDSTIDYLAQHFLTNEVKIMAYRFGYYGEISFSEEFSTDSEGICWLEKDEFLKYSGNDEEYWNNKSLGEIEYLLDELKAWGSNEVYGFVVEDAVRIQGIKTYYNGEREDEPYIDTQWEASESVSGFYGELDTVIPYMFEQTNLKQEDFEEVA
jgi:hypothetical protein